MKLLPVLSLIVISLRIISHKSTIFAEDNFPVLDTTNANLQSGVEYHILPATGQGGGLSTTSPANKTCQELDFIAQAEHGSNGMQVSFTPSNSKQDVVILSSDITIRYSTIIDICGLETIWKIVPFKGQEFVGIGGVEGKSIFRIEADKSGDYKLMYCNGTNCRDVKVLEQDGTSFLALATSDRDRAFRIQFKKSH